jgi:hypothetical protein
MSANFRGSDLWVTKCSCCKPTQYRAHAAVVLDYGSHTYVLAASVLLSDPPPDSEITAFTQAVPDACHQVIRPCFANRTHHTMFVDDTVTAAVLSRMAAAIRATVGSAYDFFGHPAGNQRDPCLKAENSLQGLGMS